jgi:HK97 family phage portal protein
MNGNERDIKASSDGFVRRFKSAWAYLRGPRSETNGAVTSPQDLARELRAGVLSSTGANVNTESAMRAAAVFACVKVISEDIASMPLNIYKRLSPAGKERASDHRLYDLLHTRPNENQTSMEFREMMQWSLLLRGNGYAVKSMVRGRVEELLPLSPDSVTPKILRGGRLQYEVQPLLGGAPIIYEREQMLHIRGLTSNGFVGRSVIQDARDAIGLAEAQEGFGAEAFRDGGLQRVALKHPGLVSTNAAGRLRDSWADIYGGAGRFAKPAVLEEGMDVVKIGLTPADMQFLDGRAWQLEDIARFFRVSPHKIGHLARATNNNVEQMALEHVTCTLLPWCVRWEQALSRDLMTMPGDDRFFIKHVVDAHLRGDPEKRHKTYAAGRQWGYYSANDVRELEDLNPIDGGDDYLVPINMRNADEPSAPPPDPGGPGDAGGSEKDTTTTDAGESGNPEEGSNE